MVLSGTHSTDYLATKRHQKLPDYATVHGAYRRTNGIRSAQTLNFAPFCGLKIAG